MPIVPKKNSNEMFLAHFNLENLEILKQTKG